MIIDLDTLFPSRKTFTDLVAYCTDPFASVESKVFASLPADVCLLYTSDAADE